MAGQAEANDNAAANAAAAPAAAPAAAAAERYTSRYFPLELNIEAFREVNSALPPSLASYADGKMSAWGRQGVSSVQMWIDADNAIQGLGPEDHGVYWQYLRYIRKGVARMSIARPAQGSQDQATPGALAVNVSSSGKATSDADDAAAAAADDPSDAPRDASSPSRVPQATAFGSRQLNPEAAAFTSNRAVTFEERCKKLSIRISAPKK
ncbi:hypothetical protein F5B20DRAFT_585859 [Whalleya microplaca]|nr:hypothetical protein F5B20DRAFT_585859 [Whalleya microplaca]